MPYDASTVKTFASSPKAGFGKVPDLARQGAGDWWYFLVVARIHSSGVGYETQKPTALLERIVRAPASCPATSWATSSLGRARTPGVVAARLGRPSILSDRNPLAVEKEVARSGAA